MKRYSVLALVLLLGACASAPKAPPAATPAAPQTAHNWLAEAGIFSGGAISAVDVPNLKSFGMRSVVDLRSDAETLDFDEAAEVRAADITYASLPIGGAEDLTLANVQRFDSLMRVMPKPLLVHCASGNRVGAMAALRAAWVQGRPVEEAITIGKHWGLTGLEPDVRERLQAGPQP